MKYIDDKIDIIITNDGSHSLYNTDLDETYHSRHGAIQESEYVYIQQGLDYYLATIPNLDHVRIFEVGFGTGSNLLLTINYLLQRPNLNINYTTIEKHPISTSLIKKLNYTNFGLNDEAVSLYHQAHECDWNEAINLSPQLTFTKIHHDIHQYSPIGEIDLIYFDAFAPSKQIDMWDIGILDKITSCLVPQGLLVTYCSQGEFKRKLKSLDLEVTTLPGPPFKKEMVRALKKKHV